MLESEKPDIDKGCYNCAKDDGKWAEYLGNHCIEKREDGRLGGTFGVNCKYWQPRIDYPFTLGGAVV